MIRILLASTLFCFLAFSTQAQYLENFTGQNGKGLVDAICPIGTTSISNCGSICTSHASDNTSTCTTIPPTFTGVTWSIVKGPSAAYFTDLSGFGFEYTSPDDFGVVADRMQVDDPDNEMCWLSPTLNIGTAGPVSIAIDVSQTGGLESSDQIRGDYSLNGGAFVAFETQSGTFAPTQLNVAGLTGTTLVIRVCALTNGGGEQIFFDNVSVPQSGVTQGCVAPVITKTTYQTGSCNSNSGSIEVTATGGTPGYNVAWGGTSSGNPGGTEIASSGGTYTITPLTAGTYTITVTDAASCSATTTTTITTATALSLSTQILAVSCSNLSDGEIDLTVSNGVAPFTYDWSTDGAENPDNDTQDQFNLAAGTYTVTVTDHAGCTATTSATVGTAAPGAYSETFSFAGKGILNPSTCSGTDGATCTNNDFAGVNWSIYGLSPLTGIDLIGDYFKTIGGVLEAFDIDQEVCWESPILDINPPGSGVAFSVDLGWTSLDHEPGPDYIDVEYSLNGGGWTRLANQFGGGTSGHTVVFVNGTGTNNTGSGTVNASGLSGSTLRIRVCGLVNGDDESFRIDNVSVPLSQGFACPQEINVKQAATNIPDGGSYNYGNVNLGSNDSKVFTIENLGDFTLTLTGTPPNYVVKGGTNPGDFTITQPVSGTILGGASTTFTVVFTPGGSGARSCTLTIGNNDSDEDPYNITLNGTGVCSPPACSVTGADFVCNNSTGNVYSATGGMSAYSWGISGAGTITSATNGSSVTVTAGNYLNTYTVSVTVTDANGCTNNCSKRSDIFFLTPPANITVNPNPACLGVTLDLSITAAASSTVSWTGEGVTNPNGNPSTTAVPTTTGPHTYAVTVTADNGCSNAGTANVTVNPQPAAPTCPSNSSTCLSTPAYALTGGSPGGGAYSGPGVSSGMFNPATAGAGTHTITYTVTDGNGCSNSCTFTISVNIPPLPTITGPTSVCSGGSAMLDAGGGYTMYAWSGGGGSGQTANFTNITSPTTYTVTVTDANGCTGTDTHTVTVNSAPAPTITGPTSVCGGGSALLDAGAGYTGYAWSGGGGSGQTANFTNITSPTTYTVTVTAANGCTGTDTHTVSVNPQPAAPTCPSNSSTCLSTPAYALTGASPGGGAYSGPGVSSGMFNPATAGAGTHTITYTVTDGNGCTNTCTFGITVLASCFIDFSGKIKFSNNPTLGVKDATVNLTGSATGSDVSDVNGDFYISTSASSGNFTLTPTKTINKLNGVTAADATAIQLHVVNTTPITDPYKQVAADVNKTNSINTLDASIITQSLLGNPSALAQFKSSWRFAPTSHTMSLPPWGFPEQRTYTGISGSQTNQDFFGIKTGDVVSIFANPANFGAGTPLVLTVADQMLEPGAALTIDLSASQLDDLIAFQFALLLDPAYLELVSVAPVTGGLPMKADDHIGLYNRAEGEVRVVWGQPTSIAVTEATPALRVQVKALQGGVKLSEVIQLEESILPGVSYNSALAESAVELRFDALTGIKDPTSESGLKLQVQPNPFREQTTVSFTLPQACEAQLRVFDVNGRELLRMNNTYPAGNNSEVLRLEGVSASGVLTCELVTPFGISAKRIILMGK